VLLNNVNSKYEKLLKQLDEQLKIGTPTALMEVQNELMAICYLDSALMAKSLFPEAFRAPFSELHYKYFDFIDNCECPRKAVIAPRGFGKTTIDEFWVKKKTLYRDKRFIGYLTNSGDIAEITSEGIKTDVMSNELVRKIFGDVSTSKVEGVKEKWSQKAWIANGYTMILPRGYGSQVNGLKWGVFRPDLWVIDDLEDRVEIRSAEQREKLRKWFEAVLMFTFSQYTSEQDNWEIIYTDTIKHQDALMCHLQEDKNWEVLNLPVCDKTYHTLAPSFKTQEEIDAIVEDKRSKGEMDIFAMEMMGLAQSEETKDFKASWIKYYNENDEDFVKRVRPRIINILIWDPAKTKNPKSADTGLVIWGLDLEYNAFYARLCVGEKLSVAEQHDRVIQLAEWYKIQALGIEVTSLEDHILYPFRNECQRRKKFWIASNIVELKARSGKGELKGEEGGKEGRIALLHPYYEKGLVWHDKVGANRLEQQLLGSRLRDVADAAAYLPQMLMKGMKFMQPTLGVEDDPFTIEQEYQQLEYEAPLERTVFA